jgi:Ca2+-binding RTX toxin-like protein
MSHDILVGGAQGDIIYAGNGFDFVDGGAGDDWLYGENGSDILRGGKGADHLYGGAGNDTYVFNRGDGADIAIDHVVETVMGNLRFNLFVPDFSLGIFQQSSA